MKKIQFLTIALIILFGCGNGDKDDFRKSMNVADNFVSSEKLNYRVDTIATGLDNPRGLTFLPNNDLLVTERDGEIRIIRDGKLLDQKITGVP